MTNSTAADLAASSHLYWAEIASIARECITSAWEEHPEVGCEDERRAWATTWLHETIDAHQWVIYCAYNLPVLMHSPNDAAYAEDVGDCDAIVRDKGLSGLHTVLAYYAMERDVCEWSDFDDLLAEGLECPECDGTGDAAHEDAQAEPVECLYCDASGHVRPAFDADGEPCPYTPSP